MAQPLIVFWLNLQLVYHDLYVMVLVAVNLHSSRYFLHLSIHANIQIPLSAHRLEKLPIMTLSLPDERGKDKDLLAGILIKDKTHDLLFRILHHFLTRDIAISRTSTSKEQS